MTEQKPKKRITEIERTPGYISSNVVLPVLIPLAAAIGTGFVIVNVSRVLLAVSKNAATVVAIAAATGILAGATVIAMRPKLSSNALVAILAAFSLAVGTAGALAARAGDRPVADHAKHTVHESGDGGKAGTKKGGATASPSPGETGGTGGTGGTGASPSPGETPPPAGGVVTLRAKGFAFEQSRLVLPAGAKVTVRMRNDDVDLHNFALYADQSASTVIYRGDTFQGPATKDYPFTAPAAGSYFFRCDVHPSMSGTAVAS